MQCKSDKMIDYEDSQTIDKTRLLQTHNHFRTIRKNHMMSIIRSVVII